MKVGHFIDKRWEEVSASLKKINLPQPRAQLKKRRAPVNEADNLSPEEGWNRKKQIIKRVPYQEGKRLKTAVDKQNILPLIYNKNHIVKNEDYYYCENWPRIYFVAYTRNVNNDSNFYLTGEGYNSLYGTQWLFNFTIDYCATILILESS